MNEEIDVLIQKTTLELLKHKEYKDIQMKEIAEKRMELYEDNLTIRRNLTNINKLNIVMVE